MVAYDHGCLKEFGTSSILCWEKEITEAVQHGVNSKTVVSHKYTKIMKYVDEIESSHPGYLHYLYRAATHVNGPKAGFAELALAMNMKSATPLEVRPTLHLSRMVINRWFLANQGTEVSAKEKLLDSPQHCILRKGWAIENYGLLTNPLGAVAHLDEKWFYRTNRRRKIKVMKLGANEKREQTK